MLYAQCKYEPRGDNGLEGYQLNESYRVQYVPATTSKDYPEVKRAFWRAWPDKNDSTYSENMSVASFNKYFEEPYEKN